MLTIFDETVGGHSEELPPRLPPRSDLEANLRDELDQATDKELADLVERIRAEDPKGMEDLYRIFSRGVRYYLCRQMNAQELEDKVHDTFLIVVQSIRRGDVREPDRLMGFIRTVVRRQVAAHIDNQIYSRREQLDLDSGSSLADEQAGPEESAISQQKAELMEKILRGLSNRDREILTRFYLDEQPQEKICEDMGLSETQFRLLKSRAKTRLGELGKKKLGKRPIRSFFLRASLSA